MCDAQRPGYRRTAGHPDEDAFPKGEQPGHLKGLAVLHRDLLIQLPRVVNPGNDGFDHVLEPLDGVSLQWLDPDDPGPPATPSV